MDILITVLGQYLLYIMLALAAVFTLQKLPRSEVRRFIFLCILSLVIAFLVDRLAAHLFYNPRPFMVDGSVPLFPHAPGNGFPSNHAIATGLIAGLVWYVDKRRGAALWLLALAVGLARVAANVHHLIDIVGGMTIALVAVVLAHAVTRTNATIAKNT